MSADHIIHHSITFCRRRPPLRTLVLIAFQRMADELFSVRDLVADYPIYKLFKPLPFEHISSLRFGIVALRSFQQLKGIHCAVSKHSGLCM